MVPACLPKLTQEAIAIPPSPYDRSPMDCVRRHCPTQKRAENRANPADLISLLFAGLCCMNSSCLLGRRGTFTSCVSETSGIVLED